MRWAMIFLMTMVVAPVSAQVADTGQARKALHSTRGYDVQVSGELSKQDAATVKAIIPLMSEQLRQPIRYFAAIAYSPTDGLVHDSLQAAMNYHTLEAAAAAALAACQPLRSTGAAPCRVAAQVVPKKFRPGGLSLSLDATAAFDKVYRKAKAPKAFAISRGTGGWGIGTSDAAAIAACATNTGGANDCTVAIRD